MCKKICLCGILLCILLVLQAEESPLSRIILNVPSDYPTIQSAITAADDGDVVLVSPGTYYENISFYGKAITVGSLYYTTQIESYIEDTIIDGGQNGNVVCFDNGESLSSVLTGFTLTNGNAPQGGGIICDNSSPVISDLIITGNIANAYVGGGIQIVNNCNVQVENVVIKDNSADHEGGGINIYNNCDVSLVGVTIRDNNAYWYGGGIMISSSSLYLEDVSIQGNSAPDKGGGICCYEGSELTFSDNNRSSIYLNHSSTACDIYSDVQIDVIVDTFTVNVPTASQAAPIENFSFDILNPLHELIYSDLYVSLEGDDLNSGTSAEESLLTISLATSIIQADSLNPHTVWIAEGTYSPSTNGEFFPVMVPENVTLSGASMENVILDADSTAGVLSFVESNNSGANNLTITHGRATDGGGIHCDYSSPLLEDLIIENNIYLLTYSHGGGIFCCHHSSPVINNVIIRNNSTIYGGGIFCEFASNPQISNVIIDNNRAFGDGGGILLRFSSYPTLSNVTIINNSSEGTGGGIYALSPPALMENVDIRNNQSTFEGGGIYLQAGSPVLSGVNITHNQGAAGGGFYIAEATPVFDTENRCNIYLNNSLERDNGCDLYYWGYDDTIQVIVDSFTVMNPTDYHACPSNMFTFDIQNAVYEQIESDLYVSTDGDNSNSGTSPEEPLKTIQYASMIVQADAEHPHTIFLAAGTYSPLTNEEYFPISLPSYVSLTGEDQQTTVLDAMDYANVIALNQSDNIQISNLTICNGEAEYGGGIKSFSTSLYLDNVLIIGNSAENSGGGIDSSYGGLLNLNNVTLANNFADRGGAIFCYQTGPNNFTNVTITSNFSNEGGAIYSYRSDFNLVNCLLWDNDLIEIKYCSSWIPSTLMIAYSDIEGGYDNILTEEECIIDWLEGNIDEDPLFNNTAVDYSLQEDSPCIDAGTAYFEYNGEVIVDLGENEYIGTAPDMGAYEYNSVEEDDPIIQNSKFKIQNFPNPFNPETTIEFNLPQSENVNLTVYNLKGQKIIELCNEHLSAGVHKYYWYGKNSSNIKAPSGIYFLNLSSETIKSSKKVLLLK